MPLENVDYGTDPRFNTALSPAEEQNFQKWKKQVAPNDSGYDYDLRGAFKTGVRPDPQTGHWPDTFKKPNHPTFSNQSTYAKYAPEMAGSWIGDTYVHPKQRPMDALGYNPKFLALPDGAKRIVLSKSDPEFAKLTPGAQDIVIAKRFNKERLDDMPAKDPLDRLHAAARGLDLADYISGKSKQFARGAAESAVRTSGPLVGGAALGYVSGGNPYAIAFGAGLGSALVSDAMGDPKKVVMLEGGLGAAMPGTGETAVRSFIKSGVFSGLASSIEERVKNGEWPSAANLAFNTIIGGITGWFGKKVEPSEIRAHLGEITTQGVAQPTHALLQGEDVKGVPKEALGEIKEIRLASRYEAMGPKGKPISMLSQYKLSPEEVQSLRERGPANVLIPPGVKTVKDVKTKGGNIEKTEHWLNQNTIFPPMPTAPYRGPTGSMRGLTSLTSDIARPRNVADHIQSQTGFPMYDQVYRPLQAAAGNPEHTNAVINDINRRFKTAPPEIKSVIKNFTQAARGYQYSKNLLYGVMRLREKLPTFGKEVTEEDAKRIVNHIISSPYTSILPGRVGPPLRVFSHTFQTGFMKLGTRWTAHGFAKMWSKQGYQDMVRAGVIGPEAFDVPQEIMGQGTGWYQRALKLGFGPFKKAQDWSRAVIFHGARDRASNALRTAKSWEEFEDKSWMDVGIPQADVAVARFLYNQGRKTELLDFVGKVHVESYIPGHSNLDRPFVSGPTAVNRMATQLLNWPSFYAQTLKENFAGPGPAIKKAQMMARWLGANAVLYNVMSEYYGDDKKAKERAAEFTFFGPTLFTIGPALQDIPRGVTGLKKMVKSPVHAVFEDPEQAAKEFRQGAAQFGGALPLPFKKGVEEASEFIYDKLLKGDTQ